VRDSTSAHGLRNSIADMHMERGDTRYEILETRDKRGERNTSA